MFVLQLVRNFFQVFELVLIIYALLSWFPNASESALAKNGSTDRRTIFEPI